jgi:hypothetical protein
MTMYGTLPTRGQLQAAMSWLSSATPALAALRSGSPSAELGRSEPVAWMIALSEEGVDHSQAITISKAVADVWATSYKIVPLFAHSAITATTEKPNG